jgi:hypothetical protein
MYKLKSGRWSPLRRVKTLLPGEDMLVQDFSLSKNTSTVEHATSRKGLFNVVRIVCEQDGTGYIARLPGNESGAPQYKHDTTQTILADLTDECSVIELAIHSGASKDLDLVIERVTS